MFAKPFITALILAVASRAPAAPEAPATDRGQLLTWTGVNRAVVRARFVAIEDENVILILENGSTRRFPLASFDPQSLEQARNAAKNAEDSPTRDTTFRRIPKGRFTMGSPLNEPGRISYPSAAPVTTRGTATTAATAIKEYEPEHQVFLSRDFWLKATEVTWKEWNRIRDKGIKAGYDISPGQCGYGKDTSDDHPVTCITWLDAVKWCNAKSAAEGRTAVYFSHPDYDPGHLLVSGDSLVYADWNASGYRLPTEAEWEYACREGRSSGGPAFYIGQISAIGLAPVDRCLDKVGWYAANSGGTSHPVGRKQPNKFGLFDLHGNASEWCWDFTDVLTPEEARDPRGAAAGDRHIFRGGSWADPARCCRAAYRSIYSPVAPLSPVVGFRPACGADPSQKPPPSPAKQEKAGSKAGKDRSPAQPSP